MPSEPAQWIYILRQLSTINKDGSNDDDGGGNSSGVLRTSRMKAHSSSHSTDTVGNSHRGNTHSYNPDSQTQFRPKPARQSAVREQKPIQLPRMQLRELFSNS
jgi:hypothetical protein